MAHEEAKSEVVAERGAVVQSWSYGGGDARGDNVGDDDGVHSAGGASVGAAEPGPAQAQGASQSESVESGEWARQVVVTAAVASCNAPVVVAVVAVVAAAVCASSNLFPSHVPWRALFRSPLFRVHLVHNQTRQAARHPR
jgi:hypothetical protein